MKSLLIFILSCLTALSVYAQTVTITVNGNRNRQVLVDGRSFTVENSTTSTTLKVPIILNDLQTGQHTLQIVRTNPNTGTTNRTSSTTFTLRPGYDLEITINGNGSVAQTEKRIRRTGNLGQNRTPMLDAEFNTLLQDVKSNWRQSVRLTKVTDAFEVMDDYFTTSQAMQLIQQITSQTNRLKLAKLAYLRISDPSNFSQMYSLLTSQAGKNDLAAFVRAQNVSTVSSNQSRSPMSDINFNDLYSDVQELVGISAKVTALNTVFANTSNYFTTTQARQLLLLVNDENSRLHLAKTSYRGITDPANFSQLYDVLSFQANRNELAAYVSNYHSVGYTNTYPAYKTPMTAESFNTLYSRIQNTWGLGAKMSELSTVFSNTSYYFTTAQAEQLIRLVSSESNRLALAKASYDNITDPANFSTLYDMLNSQSSRDELAAYINTNTGSTINTGTYNTPMSVASFNSLYSRVQNSWGTDAKMSDLNEIFANTSYYFSTTQAEELIRLVSGESNRLLLAKASYNNITDPANFTMLFDVLNSQSSRDELAAYVNISTGVGTGTTYKTPMTTANYNGLYNRIQNTWGLGAKMSVLVDVFASTTDYFTTAQAEELIRLVSSETNRLQLAKSSYDNITDPANFSNLYDVLSSQASRDELAAYVNTYSTIR